MEEIKNNIGGYIYSDKENKIAKPVDLITLPKDVCGTNCANCRFVSITSEEEGNGFCNHPKVMLPVTARMCCALWDNAGALRSWKDEEIPEHKRKTIKEFLTQKVTLVEFFQ